MTAPDNGDSRRITVSESLLDAKLSQLELRLVDRLTVALAGKVERPELDEIRALQREQAVTIESLSKTTITAQAMAAERRAIYRGVLATVGPMVIIINAFGALVVWLTGTSG